MKRKSSSKGEDKDHEKRPEKIEKIAHTEEEQEEERYVDGVYPWILPVGAASIVRQIAAERIFEELFVNFQKKDNKVLHAESYSLIQEFPSLCHRMFEFVFQDGEKTRQEFSYPLGLICCLQPPLALVKLAYEANPQVLLECEPVDGSLPIHNACCWKASKEVISFLVSKEPRIIRETERQYGAIPLHLALMFHEEPSVVEFLLDAWPESSHVRDNDLFTPLHSAAMGSASLSVVKRLCQSNPDSMLQVDKTGRTPLHVACDIGPKDNGDLVQFLLQQAPQALTTQDQQRNTPLFSAACCQSLDVLQILLQHLPQQQQQPQQPPHAGAAAAPPPPPRPPLTHAGATLLHLASQNSAPGVMEYLMNRYPEMITAQTVEGCLPIHCATFMKAPLANVKKLVQRHPRTLLQRDADGDRPLDIAQEHHGVSSELVQYLAAQTSLVEAALEEE